MFKATFLQTAVLLHILLCFSEEDTVKETYKHHAYHDLSDIQNNTSTKLVKLERLKALPSTQPTPRPIRNFSNTSKNLVFMFGVPGSGVTTLAKRLSQTLFYSYLSVNELLLNASRTEPNLRLRRTLRTSLQQDYIIPSKVTYDLIEKAVHGFNKRAYIVDGFPRTLADILEWEKRSKSNQTFTQLFIYLSCGKATSISRGLKRNDGQIPDEKSLRAKFDSFRDYSVPLLNYISSTREFYGIFERVAAYKSIKEVQQEATLAIRRQVASARVIRVINQFGIIPRATTVSPLVMSNFRKAYPEYFSLKHRFYFVWTDTPNLVG